MRDRSLRCQLFRCDPIVSLYGKNQSGKDQWSFSYLLDAITPVDGSRHTDFKLLRWNDGKESDSCGLLISVNGHLPMYAGWFGTFWSAKPETTPVIHFGGPVTPTMLRFKDFTIGSGPRRLSVGFMNQGFGSGAQSRLSIDALPAYVVPWLKIEWPAAGGGLPLKTSHQLLMRCCYWEFYTTDFKVPEGVGVGTARVFVEFPAVALPIEFTTTEIEVPVVSPSSEEDSGVPATR